MAAVVATVVVVETVERGWKQRIAAGMGDRERTKGERVASG